MEKLPFHVPEEWLRLYEELSTTPGLVFLLGAPDTGKTTLAHFLIYNCVLDRIRVAYVDGDLGQSVVGPPTTLGMASPSEPPVDMQGLEWHHLYFIGATSPATHLLATATGMRKLCQCINAKDADVVIVDTSGLVAGAMGFQLKFSKIELLNPRHIVAIQRDKEVDHILKGCRGRRDVTIHRLHPSQSVQSRPPDVRRAYRNSKFQQYFRHSTRKTLLFDSVEYISPELPRLSHNGIGDRWRGRLVGLNDDTYLTQALGIWEEYDARANQLTLITPLVDVNSVKFIHIGDITVTLDTWQEHIF